GRRVDEPAGAGGVVVEGDVVRVGEAEVAGALLADGHVGRGDGRGLVRGQAHRQPARPGVLADGRQWRGREHRDPGRAPRVRGATPGSRSRGPRVTALAPAAGAVHFTSATVGAAVGTLAAVPPRSACPAPSVEAPSARMFTPALLGAFSETVLSRTTLIPA